MSRTKRISIPYPPEVEEAIDAIRGERSAATTALSVLQGALGLPHGRSAEQIEERRRIASQGGRARAAKLTPERRKAIARAGVAARWGKKRDPDLR